MRSCNASLLVLVDRDGALERRARVRVEGQQDGERQRGGTWRWGEAWKRWQQIDPATSQLTVGHRPGKIDAPGKKEGSKRCCALERVTRRLARGWLRSEEQSRDIGADARHSRVFHLRSRGTCGVDACERS
jgi:hypothetical protein